MSITQSIRPTTCAAPDVSVVVPLFDEDQTLLELYRRLTASLAGLEVTYELIFVNDGSTDTTGELIGTLHGLDQRVVGLHLSRNFGHQAAISAGIDHARGRAVIVMDGDLQDPPEVLGEFLARWQEGYEVVYAVRTRRKEGWWKRAGYFCFYRLLSAISDLEIPLDSGDFCLMDRKVADVLKHLPERNRFIRGLRTFVGFRQVGVCYERAVRSAGQPKYTFRKLVGLALDGLIGFSSYPLRLVTYLGFASAALAIALTVWVLADCLSAQTAPPGWASTIVVVLFMSAIQLLSLGILGEYVRRIFIECKGRPTYVVGSVQAETDVAAPSNQRIEHHTPAHALSESDAGARTGP